MPWYTKPVITCKVLNRIANRHPRASIQELDTVLDYATQLIWSKQERFYSRYAANLSGCKDRNN